ncbi:MAG TPA: hypothetical protein VFX52_12680 [Nocardioidaceae bacterium]|nr:hypothetical protein [Nocardioidaceae bacterium]
MSPLGVGVDSRVVAGLDALARSTRDDGPGPRLGPVALVERLGAITTRLAGDWLTRSVTVKVTTVLHTDGPAARTTSCWPPTRPTVVP